MDANYFKTWFKNVVVIYSPNSVGMDNAPYHGKKGKISTFISRKVDFKQRLHIDAP